MFRIGTLVSNSGDDVPMREIKNNVRFLSKTTKTRALIPIVSPIFNKNAIFFKMDGELSKIKMRYVKGSLTFLQREPLSFMKKNWSGLKKDGRCVLKLGIDKRFKRWEIDLCGLALRMAGWKIFMKDNNVSEDDICVFELINPHENMLKVSIIRSVNDYWVTTMDSARRPSFPADPFNFIRIIVSNDVRSTRIKIPKEFTERGGGDLPETVTFKVPNGDIWQVGLVDLKGAIWFDDGWMEFAEHYKLRFGHLLMFKYQRLLNFRVHIYDPNGCEMVYPKKQESDQDACGIVNLVDSEDTESDQDDAEIEIDGEGECSSMRIDGNGAKTSFKSDKPFFMAYMTRDHIIGKSNVRVPWSFIKQHWSGLKQDGRCVLRIGMDKRLKKWEVDLHGLCLKMAGWKIFMKDNNVSEDDICVFELINPHENMLKVSIIRRVIDYWSYKSHMPTIEFYDRKYDVIKLSSFVEKQSISPQEQLKDDSCYGFKYEIQMENEAMAEDDMKGLNSEECPQFFKFYMPTHCSKQLLIPRAFVKYFNDYLPLKFVLVTSAKKSWDVGMNKVDDDVYLKRGWEEFVQDNSLEFGDFLIFYYNGGSKFYVSVYGNNNCLKETEADNNQTEKQPPDIQLGDETNRGETKRISVEDIDLSFEIPLQLCYMKRGFITMPKVFSERVKKEYRPIAKLQHSGQTWDVEVVNSCGRYGFKHGWKLFLTENCVAFGDICCFKLIDIKPKFYLLDVSFSREI
ncbi:hypothetical protein OSB04_007433 [Centaurea solstitialis]|uniref:TF-B3 domain-containing protein n=1 Tax=Centaurea solstitialis TaxID=347529 RepID=A0AA38TJW0_9ASTR|nr:hypothetical protein OSB04_007433 [Centaurea solstitialis]